MKKLVAFLSGTSGSLRTRTIRGGIWITGSTIFLRLFELLGSVILARLLVPKVFGVVSIVLFVRNGIDVFTKTSFKSALIYRKNDIEDSADTAWVLNAARGIVLAVAAFLFAPLIAGFYREPVLGPAIRLMSIVFVLDGFANVNMVRFDKSLDFKKIAISRIFGSFFYCVLTVSLAFAMKNLWALVIGIVFKSAYDFGISYLIQKKRPRPRFDRKVARELFRYSKYVTGSGILVYLTTRGDDAVIGKLLSLEQLGYYTYAYAVANLPATHITSMFSELIFPSYSAINDDIPKLGQAFLAVQKLVAYVAFPVGVLLAVLSREIVVLVLGPGWESAVTPLRVLIVFGVVRSLAATTGPLLKALGKPHVIFWIVLVKLVFILAIIIPLTRLYGLVGASLAVTLPMVVEQFYLWSILKRLIAVRAGQICRQLLRPAALSLIAGAAAMAWKLQFPVDRISALALLIVCAFSLYGGASWAFDKRYFQGLLSG